MNIERRFLDYDGLETLWNKINAKFADNSEAVGAITVSSDADNVSLIYNYVNDESEDVKLPIANDDTAGIITASTYRVIENLQAGEGGLVPIKGLKLDGKEVSLNDRLADIKLELISEGEKTYLSLVDSRFVGGAHWTEITLDEYNAATNNGGSGRNDFKSYDGEYYRWISGDNNLPPAVDVNKNPIVKKPESRIDATSFIQHGLLQGLSYGISDGKPTLTLTFNKYNGNTVESEEIPVDLSDLIDVYTNGEGIEISETDYDYNNKDYNTAKISLKTATVDNLGGVKIAKGNTYSVESKTSNITSNIDNTSAVANRYRGIEIDSNDKAFVYTPWKDVVVNNATLSKEDDDINLTTFVDLSDATKTSLALADSALQYISILNETITQDNPELTIDNAKKDLALGTAAGVNITTNTTLTEKEANVISRNSNKEEISTSKPTVPTTDTVKTYVDTTIENVINSLDSSIELPTLNYGISETDVDVKYFKGTDIPHMFTNVSMVDGMLDKNSSLTTPISIYYIHDFAPITTEQINEICK